MGSFLFSMYLDDIEETFIRGKFQGLEIGMLKLFLLLYADDIVIFADNENMLQKGLEILYDYCTSWKLRVNTNKTKIMILGEEEFYHAICIFCIVGKNRNCKHIHIPWYCFLYWRVFCRYI